MSRNPNHQYQYPNRQHKQSQQKQKEINININDYQSFMFSSRNLVQYTKHIFKEPTATQHSNIKIKNKEIAKPIIKEIFEPIEKDCLFWCFYVLLYGQDVYEMVGNQHYVEEKKKKFEYIALLRTKKPLLKMHKIKPLSEIEDDLANKDKISLKTFIALCLIHEVNVFVINKRRFFEGKYSDQGNMHIIVKKNDLYYVDLLSNEVKINEYKDTYFAMNSIDCTLKSMSFYKLDELIEISKKLGIEYDNNDKKKTKKEIYELIIMNF